MYPRGLFAVLPSVDQRLPDRLTGSSSMRREGLNRAPVPFKGRVQSSTNHLAFPTLYGCSE